MSKIKIFKCTIQKCNFSSTYGISVPSKEILALDRDCLNRVIDDNLSEDKMIQISLADIETPKDLIY